ncbi:MAG: peptidylprolyl isomerase [Rhodocyclaceae bacterium]|nr:peptidylprolyl isomerase [Rhodocyclaceae bacterium]MBX3668873.1 peptidylprolyl isomerase [Rhodocyclaceae bacterium]
MALKKLLLLGLLIPLVAAAAQTPIVEVDRVMAVVNEEVITAREVGAGVARAEGQLRARGTPLPAPSVLERQVLERLINDRVQLQFAKEVQIRIDDAALEQALQRIAENNGFSSARLREEVEKEGMSWGRFREDIRTEITIARLREREVDARLAITEGEVDNFIAAQAAGGGAEELLVSHILLRVPERASPDQLLRIRGRAEAALEQLNRGEDFAKVAASYSDAPDALSGASLGWRAADRLPTLFGEQLAAMKPGEVSPVLRSPAGFHILKFVDRRSSGLNQKLQQTHVRHILIKTSEVVSDAEARRRLLGLRERIANGADFGELARLNSADLTASKGGDLGWIYPGDTVPEFEHAFTALEPGQLSQPVQTTFGWHLIQVIERRVAEASTDRRRMAARAALRERKSDEAYLDWLRQLRDRAYVEYRSEDR